jgi:tRNA G18 (ribose-2'-O)-methylase SpoU
VIHPASAGDPLLDPYRRVGDPSWLEDRQLFVAEGRLVVERLLASGAYALDSIAVTPAALDALRTALERAPCDVYVCDRAVLEAVTGFDFHRGCLAVARRPQPRALFRRDWPRSATCLAPPSTAAGTTARSRP